MSRYVWGEIVQSAMGDDGEEKTFDSRVEAQIAVVNFRPDMIVGVEYWSSKKIYTIDSFDVKWWKSS